MLTALRQSGLVANPKKSKLGGSAVQYLGFNIGGGKDWPIQDKVAVLEQAAPPTRREELQSILGLANYHRRFVPNLATMAAPLTNLLKGREKGTKAIQLPLPAVAAYQGLKRAL